MRLYEATVTVRVVFGSDCELKSEHLAEGLAIQCATKELKANHMADKIRIKELKRPSDTTETWRDSYPWNAPKKTVREILTGRKD